MNLRLRPEQLDDEPFLFRVYEGVRLDELGGVGWDPAFLESFLRMQFRAMIVGYRRTFPKAEYAIIQTESHVIGRIVVDRSEDEIRVVDLALLPEHRNCGVGTQLIRLLMDEAAVAKKPIRLSTRKDGRPSRWYARLGFQKLEESDLLEHLEWRAGA